MKRKIYMVLFVCLVCGCTEALPPQGEPQSKDDTPQVQLSVKDKLMYVGEESSDVEICLLNPMPVEFSVSEDWICFKRQRSENSYVFEVAENFTYDDRKGQVYISAQSGDQHDTVTVFQSKKNAIILSYKEVSFDNAGGEADIVLKSNIEFSCHISDEEWIEEIKDEKTKALVDNVLHFRVLCNPGRFDRSGKILFCNDDFGQKDSLRIAQLGVEGVLKLRYSGDSFDGLTLEGENIYGTIDWGDEKRDTVSSIVEHRYDRTGEKTVEIRMHNSTGFVLENIAGVSMVDFSKF